MTDPANQHHLRRVPGSVTGTGRREAAGSAAMFCPAEVRAIPAGARAWAAAGAFPADSTR